MSEQQATQRVAIDPGTEIGWTALTVADLERALQFYTEVLGFAVLARAGDGALLGAGDVPLLALVGRPDAPPRPPRTTGLYHFAILLPSRADLGRALRQLSATGYPLDGYADHLVSEALYLTDPEGNGIEIYRDRPRSEWRWQDGRVQMASDPIDLAALIAEGDRDGQPWRGLPGGTVIGHMHLQVADIPQAEAFYHGLLGFDIAATWPGALFISAGGYHHHLGLNTWGSRAAPPPPAAATGLRVFALSVPDAAAVTRIAAHLETAGVAADEQAGVLALHDPWQNRIVIVPRAGLRDAAARAQAGAWGRAG